MRRGGGRKVRALPRKVCLPWVSKRGIWDVPGILPGCPGPPGGVQKSAFTKRGACKRGLRKLGHRTYQLHSNNIPETWSNHDGGGDFPLEDEGKRGRGWGGWGGWVGTGKGTGKSMRKLCRNYPGDLQEILLDLEPLLSGVWTGLALRLHVPIVCPLTESITYEKI